MDKEIGDIKTVFPQLIERKLKQGFFTGSQIRKLIEHILCKAELNEKELVAWNCFVNIVK